MEDRTLDTFVSIRVEIIRQIFDMACDFDHDKTINRRLMVFAGSLSNEITPHQERARKLFDNTINNLEIPHIMNSTLSAFKSYGDTTEIKPVWKPWKPMILKEA